MHQNLAAKDDITIYHRTLFGNSKLGNNTQPLFKQTNPWAGKREYQIIASCFIKPSSNPVKSSAQRQSPVSTLN